MQDIDPRFGSLFHRIEEVLHADPRVKDVLLAGSTATNTADKWSDLDVHIITVHERHSEFLDDWKKWLDLVTPTVFARRPIAPFIVNSVTSQGLTLDISVFADQDFSYPSPTGTYFVGGLSSHGFNSISAALEYAVLEQLRGLAGPFISLIERDENMRHLAGVSHLMGLLTTVFLAESNSPPPNKHWNRTYTAEQRQAVAALPAVRATRESLLEFGLAIAQLVVQRARPLFDEFNLEWPCELAEVVSLRLTDLLNVDVSNWLY